MAEQRYSAINLAGLSIGMAAAMLILLWVHNEMSYDRFHEKTDRIALLYSRDINNGQLDAWPANRIKEIGVRKVLGASVAGITALLSGDFLKLVLISVLIASPVAWYAMNVWLQDFNYRVHVSIWVFLDAGLLSVFIAVLTVSYQAIKAAMANPVRSLRTE